MREKVESSNGQWDGDWTCLCGNEDFFPCDKEGKEVEPVETWEDLYCCSGCGRIIEQRSMEVIGKAK